MPEGNGVVYDILEKIADHLEKSNEKLDKLYMHWQHIEANKTPAQFRPSVINLVVPTSPTPISWQIVRSESRRSEIAIINLGPDDILYSNENFDPLSILQDFSDPNAPAAVLPAPLETIHIGFAPSGSSFVIDSRSSIWAYNIQGAGALLSIIDTTYESRNTSLTPERGSIDGMAHQGYVANGQKALR